MKSKLSPNVVKAFSQLPREIRDIIRADMCTAFENRVKTFTQILEAGA